MRFVLQSSPCVAGVVQINRPHLFLGAILNKSFYPPQDFVADVKPLEVYIDDASNVDVDLIPELELRDAGTKYTLAVAGVGNVESVIFLALKDIPR